MKLHNLTIVAFLSIVCSYGQSQDFDGPRPTGSASDGINLLNYYNTNIQLTAITHSGSHGILFNAYKDINYAGGNLATTGNVKYANSFTGHSTGAGGIIFYGNGGNLDFVISPISTGQHTNVIWGTPKMRIQRNGNVGIGTASPSAKLEVRSDAISGQENLQIWKINDATSDYLKIFNATAASGQFIPSIYGYHDTDNRQALYISGAIGSSNDTGLNPVMIFDSRIDNGPINNRTLFSWDSYGNRKMVLTASGNLGIGTNNPDAKLTVKGTIHTEEVKVDLSVPGPDYVFEPDYNLKSLEETAAYIKANKHLPEIPSAKEMEANGVQLGEMNMLLLKKIEELTLHLIQNEKEKDILRQQLKANAKSHNEKIEELTLHLINQEKRIQELENSKN